MRQYRGIPIDEAKDSGKFLFGGFYERSGKSYIIRSDATFLHQFLPIKYARFIEVHPATVGQSTGLQDKNGTEVYSGDIVYWYDDRLEAGRYKAKVEWDWMGCRLMLRRIGYVKSGHSINVSDGKSMEIIGNIHEDKK